MARRLISPAATTTPATRTTTRTTVREHRSMPDACTFFFI
jgi:hypothetical protein